MNPKLLKLGAAALLVALAAYSGLALRSLDTIFHEEVAEFEDLARRMNIRNLVSTIYLGPRILDTFLEVMVVVLAVFGMNVVREEP